MIFSIEKRRFRRGGRVEETRSYYLRYRIGDMPVDKWKSLGVTDKQVADQKAHKFIQEREREAAGILEPQAVRDSARKPLTAHLDDYVADLAARGRNGRGGRGARLVASRIRALLQACDWQVPCNVTADSFIVWRNRQTCSPRTLNHYLQGMISLLNWMERVGRIKTNPLKNVSRADERKGVKPGIRNSNCGTLAKLDQFRQTFHLKLDLAKQLGHGILRSQLAFAQRFPLRRHCVWQNRSESRGFLPRISGIRNSAFFILHSAFPARHHSLPPRQPNRSICGGGASFFSFSSSGRRAWRRTLPSGVSSDSSRLARISLARSSTVLGRPARRATWMP